MIQADPSGRFVLHVDLGLDRIFVWKFETSAGVLTPNDLPVSRCRRETGPGISSFIPTDAGATPSKRKGPTSFCSTMMVLGGRPPRQTLSSLPPGFAGSNFCSEILVSTDGRFVYAGNRLHDSIGDLLGGPNGELSYVDDLWSQGDYPRSFSFDPTGQFLYSCNQRGDNVAVSGWIARQAGLRFTGQYIPVGNPSIIVFLDLAKAG